MTTATVGGALVAMAAPWIRWRRNKAGVSSAALRQEILERGSSPARALALGDALEAEGNLIAAVEALHAANRLGRSAPLERRLVLLRRAAFNLIDRSAGVPPTGNGEESPSVEREIVAAALTPTSLRQGIRQHGSLLVRGLVSPERASLLAGAVDSAFSAYDAHQSGVPLSRTTPWFDPLEDVPDGDYLRHYVRKENCVLAGDSPRALWEFLETVYQLRLKELIASYIGEAPALSLQKTSLRRAEPDQTGNAWHQDGAFLGTPAPTLNLWFSLSRSGSDAPGLDIVPARLDRILPVGTPGALYNWDVAESVVRQAYPRGEFWRPQLEPGDVFFFDDLCLHRTALEPSMTRRRWAIESWFFAPSAYPAKLTPLVV